MTRKYEKYKSSGVEWIGEIPEHWEIKRLKNVLNIKKQLVGSKSGNYLLLSLTLQGVITRNLENPKGKFPAEFNTYQAVKKNDLIFCLFDVEETPRTIGISYSDGMITGAYTIASVTENILSEFVYYYYLSRDQNKELKMYYSGLRNVIKKEVFYSIPFPTPPFSDQQKIVAYLDKKSEEINKFIKNKEELIKLLEEEKKSIITKVVTKGLNKNVKLKDSGVEWLGEVPEHWEVTKLKYLTKKIVDGTHFTPNYINEGVPFLRITDLTSKEINLDVVRRISKEEHKELTKRCLPEKGDILLTKNGTIGVTKVIDWDYEFSIFVSICLIKFNQYLTAYYFEKFFKSFVVEEQLFSSSKVTSVTNLHLDKIRELLIVFPKSIKEQQEIVAYLDKETKKIDDLKAKYRQEINLIKEYKERLVYDVVTGKMNVLEH